MKMSVLVSTLLSTNYMETWYVLVNLQHIVIVVARLVHLVHRYRDTHVTVPVSRPLK